MCVEDDALRTALVELARELGIDVREESTSGADGLSAASGVCRVRGELRIVLARGEPAAAHVSVLVSALRDHSAARLESRWLAPALRARLGLDA